MSSMVFKFLTSERIEVLQGLIFYYTGEEHQITEEERPVVPGDDGYTDQRDWPEYLTWDREIFGSPNYKWYEWYTYQDVGSAEFLDSVLCMCKIKNLLVVAGEAHSVTYEYGAVGWSIEAEDSVKLYETYIPDAGDLKVQTALRFAVDKALKKDNSPIPVPVPVQHAEYPKLRFIVISFFLGVISCFTIINIP